MVDDCVDIYCVVCSLPLSHIALCSPFFCTVHNARMSTSFFDNSHGTYARYVPTCYVRLDMCEAYLQYIKNTIEILRLNQDILNWYEYLNTVVCINKEQVHLEQFISYEYCEYILYIVVINIDNYRQDYIVFITPSQRMMVHRVTVISFRETFSVFSPYWVDDCDPPWIYGFFRSQWYIDTCSLTSCIPYISRMLYLHTGDSHGKYYLQISVPSDHVDLPYTSMHL